MSEDEIKTGAKLKKADWEVRGVSLGIARPIVEKYHYAHGASNTFVYLHGLFKKHNGVFDNECSGVAWWIPPTKSAAKATHPANWRGVLSLSRLVIKPSTPKNACTFLLARSRALIDRELWPCLVTYADDWQGHKGTIYKADNWHYCGMTKPQQIFVKNNRVVSRKAGPKTRTKKQMIELGCEYLGDFKKHKFIHIATQ
jgi:hypothetical protein